MGIALNHDGTRLIVADTGNDRIQIFTTGGQFIRSVGYDPDPPKSCCLLSDGRVHYRQRGRTEANELGVPCFRSPYDVAISGHLIFVTDGLAFIRIRGLGCPLGFVEIDVLHEIDRHLWCV